MGICSSYASYIRRFLVDIPYRNYSGVYLNKYFYLEKDKNTYFFCLILCKSLSKIVFCL